MRGERSEGRRLRRYPCAPRLGLAALLSCLPAAGAAAVEVDGNLLLSAGPTDIDGVETELVEQQASLGLRQQLTGYLTLRLGYRYFDFTSETAGSDFTRRTIEPRAELIYSHPTVFGSVSVSDRAIRGTDGADELDVESLTGNLSWRAMEPLLFTVRYRDESNVADPGVFGLGTDTRQARFESAWQQRTWSATYAYETWDASNPSSGLDLSRDSHELRLDGGRSLLDGRLWLGLSSWGRLTERRQTVGDLLGDPVPVQAGLFAVDPSPESGTLEVVLGLVDGDTATPTAPRIDVGGASTFRNVGVDLGITRPISQLEISVDVPSEPGLVWRVFRSRDNLLWEPVPGAASEWDGALLRYLVRFPSTEDRFFKAVNVSVNSQPLVAVTEVRALRDVLPGAPGEDDTTFYRLDGTARFLPHERVSGTLSAGVSRDEGLAGSVVRRDFRDVHGSASVTVALPRDLRWTTAYRYSDFEDRVEPVLLRTEQLFSSQLGWTPLPTVSATATYQQRREDDEGTLIRDSRTLRLSLLTELLPELDLDSTVERTEVEDPFFGQNRTVTAWRERLQAQVFPNLLVGGGFSYLRYEGEGGELLLDRTSLDLRASWRAGAYLTLTGDWSYGEDQVSDSLRQSYAATFTPGDRLTLTAAYDEFTDQGLRETNTASGSLEYRVNDRFRLFGNYTRSETVLGTLEPSVIESMRLGAALSF
jgi:hypothetical protein